VWDPLSHLPTGYTLPTTAPAPSPAQPATPALGNPAAKGMYRHNLRDWWRQMPTGLDVRRGPVMRMLRGDPNAALSGFFPNPTAQTQTWLDARPQMSALSPWQTGF
jgi:hypothetical protein